MIKQILTLGLILATGVSSNPFFHRRSIHFKGPFTVDRDSVHNIHIHISKKDYEGELRVVYGDCNLGAVHDRNHEVSHIHVEQSSHPVRLVWIVPRELSHNGCLHAYSGDALVGRSSPITIIHSMRKRQSIADVADTSGPWFDGVAYLQSKNQSTAVTSAAKAKKIAIVGGGMAGLLTSLLLTSVGINDWHIHEASQRIGGRIRTKYLNNTTPENFQYQEMGPMRFPVSTRYVDTNETVDINDHKMVFQLGEELNKLNNNASDLAVNFIPWIQSSPNTPTNTNGFRLPDGRIPSSAQVKTNSSLVNAAAMPPDAAKAKEASKAVDDLLDLSPARLKAAAQNIFKAHKEAISRGLFQFSEAAYLRYALGLDANTTDFVGGSTNLALWGEIYDSVYFAATTWVTIDKGLESLPRAFLPHVRDKTTFGRKIEGLSFNAATSQISLQWRDNEMSQVAQTEAYDYAIVAAPFSKVRLWRIPKYSSSLSRAISTMNYIQSCKVALHYKTRFWEHLDPPIIGGCGITDIPGLGSVCYPSYEINSTRPGVLLGSYITGIAARSVAALSTADHVAFVQRAMVEVHGEIASEQFTGIYDRQCWEVDEHQAGAWAEPLAGQQDLYLPSYYQTEFMTIFIGEHTSYTHAWIFSALDSAVRGTTQLLLDLGLVDEAKQVVNEWMGRWISI